MEDLLSIREKALEDLARFGIKGEAVYFIDLIPLLEMLWADGRAQPSELALFEEYLRKHVQRINALSDHMVVDYLQAREFVGRFLEKRPDPDLLKTLAALVAPARLSSSDEEANQRLRESLLGQCLDIASAAVVEYPYGIHDRFDPAEKKCFFELLDSLKQKP